PTRGVGLAKAQPARGADVFVSVVAHLLGRAGGEVDPCEALEADERLTGRRRTHEPIAISFGDVLGATSVIAAHARIGAVGEQLHVLDVVRDLAATGELVRAGK